MPFATRPYAARPESAWRRFTLNRNASHGAISLTGAVATTLLALTTTLVWGQSSKAPVSAKQKAEMLYARTPMSFEPNRGQVSSPEVQYLAHGARYGVALTAEGAMLSLDAGPVDAAKSDSLRHFDQIRLELPRGNRHAQAAAEEKLGGRVNYLLGNDPAKWHTDLPTYGKVRYAGVYPGVDLVYYGNQGRLEYDFVVAPHANSRAVGLHFEGAKSLQLDAQGNLTIQAAHGAVVFEKPLIYQEKDGKRELVEGSFRLEANNTAGFTIGRYDHSRALVIDPALVYATYLGGSTNELISSAVVDVNGSLYVTGTTYSSDFPTTPGVFQPTAAHASSGLAFTTKFNPQGTAISYSSFIGGVSGQGSSRGYANVVDANGSVYIVGSTTATDFPVSPSAIQKTNPEGTTGNTTGFVFRLNIPGNGYLYSTYLGGSGGGQVGDTVNGIAIDAAGDAIVAGTTDSNNFPVTTGAYQTSSPNPNLGTSTATSTGFVASVNPTGSALNYATYLGGSGTATLTAVKIDSAGNAYVTGTTALPVNSTNYPVTSGAFQTTNSSTGTGLSGVVTKLNPTGTALVYSTFLGSNGTMPTSIAVDASGNAYVGGTDLTGGFPATSGAYQTTWASGSGFVASLKAAGNGLNFGTFLSGPVNALGLDSTGLIVATGSTTNSAFPVSPDALQLTFPTVSGYYPATAAYLVRLSASGAAANYSSYFSGSSYTAASALAIDGNNNVYIGGQTCSTDLPVSATAAQQTKFSPDCSATGGLVGFAAKFALGTAPIATGTSFQSPTGQVQLGTSITLVTATAPSTATGNVNFFEGSKALGSAPLVNGGASLTNQTFSLGTHTITAVYTGDINYAESTAAPSSFTVVQTLPVAFSPATITFATPVQVGLASGAMNAQIINSGTTAVTLYSLGMNGDFTEEDNCPVSVPNGLAAGASCGLQITFRPSGTGTRIGNASLISSISSIPQTLSLTGTGTAPTVALSATSASFPDTAVGATSAPTVVTLTNSASAGVLFISSIVATGDFAQTNTCGSSLSAGGSCTISITFSPTTPGARTGAVTITDNSSTGTTQTISLTGNGASLITVSPSSLTFGSQAQGTTSAAQTIKLTTAGSSSVTINSIVATGDFAQTNNCGATLAGNSNCTISVTFTPTVGSGTRTGSVTVTSSASPTPQTVSLTGTVAAAAVTLSPSSLNFSGQLTGTTSASQSVVLTNSGNVALGISSIGATGDFAQTNACGSSLAAGGSCTISVTFTPTVTGARTGAVTIVDSASGSPHTVALTGTGTAPAGSIAPSALTFAAQSLGTTSMAQIVTLTNVGTAPLTVSSVSITGAYAQTNTCSTSIAAGGSCAISVTFSPTVNGTLTGTLTVTDNAAGSPRVVSLTGTGVTPVTTVTVSPSSLTYTTQNTGTTSAAKTVTLTNTGNAALTISSIGTTGDYAQTNTCGTTLAVSTSCTIAVTFTPTTSGTRTGLLVIGDNAAGSPQSVSLTGTAITPAPVVVLAPASLTFATQNTGTTSAAQTITLSNTGNAALTLTSIAASGDYAQTNNCGTSVAASASCTIAVTFTPTASGTRTGAITVLDNATGSPHMAVLTGTGVVPAAVATFSLTTLNFGSQQTGTTSVQRSVSLTNTGNTNLTISSIVASGDFAQTNSCSTGIVVPNASCTISVTFTPTTTGTRTGSITVTDNAAGSPQTIALTGTGTAPALSVAFSPLALSFGSVTTGSTSAVQFLTMTNTGFVTLAITSITATGDFAQTNTCGTSLAPNGNCRISVTFSPTTTGTRIGFITVVDNATGSPQQVALSGTGTGISLTSTAASTGLTISAAGASATTTLQLGSTSYTGLVYVTCSVAYTGTGTAVDLPGCSLAPPSQTITAGAASVPVVLTVSTTASAAMNHPAHRFPWTPAGASLATLFLMGWISPKRRRGIRLLTLLLAVVLGGLAGCAGGGTSGTSLTGTSTSAGTYNVIVTAANGGTAASVTISVKVL
ncbi:Beta-propeller repeat-containing protein [Granulicella pectinivorans]|uniref:Beta-propeller repeat-containing protein n=1 Tax=Granulicella pectinivorans TaxID=474950 RepID=A0A1I6LLQ9_9BACT|nr:choice-of-anchor D domain-containing protein [Granulicella pectinivorans]SFS04260.1 Beta-propeller repeat-containing protein [Granulicella pectinivorans]